MDAPKHYRHDDLEEAVQQHHPDEEMLSLLHVLWPWPSAPLHIWETLVFFGIEGEWVKLREESKASAQLSERAQAFRTAQRQRLRERTVPAEDTMPDVIREMYWSMMEMGRQQAQERGRVPYTPRRSEYWDDPQYPTSVPTHHTPPARHQHQHPPASSTPPTPTLAQLMASRQKERPLPPLAQHILAKEKREREGDE